MTTLNKLIENKSKEFDKKFSTFNGVGATHPIFKNSENPNHIKYFLSQSIKAGYELAIKDVEKWVNDKDKGGRYCSAVGNFVYMEELNELLQSLLKEL